MAENQSRNSPWRQGMVLDPRLALDLGLISPGLEVPTVSVMVTHDCDIASDVAREPNVEVIVGHRIDALGADTNAKTARRLHIAFQTNAGPISVELQAAGKTSVPKQKVLAYQPCQEWSLNPDDLVTLQKWLAARYYRSAFADEFERRLKEKPFKLDRKISKTLDESSQHILAVLFNVDDGHEIQRVGEKDVYQLHIILLYDSTKDEPAAYNAAEKSANTIEDAFEKAYFVNGEWSHIQLLSCIAVSDSAMTVAQSRQLKQWRLDHVSLEADPQEPMLE